MSRELLQQALDALENGKKVRAGEGGTKYQLELEDAAIEALEAALAQPEQEPVAWMLPDYGDVLSASEADGTGIYNIPLYTAPPKPEQDWDLLAATQESLREHQARIKKLEAQLAQPEQEPVKKALRLKPHECICGYSVGHPLIPKCICKPEYTAQPEQEELIQFKDGKWSYVRKPWQGLTNEELVELREAHEAHIFNLMFAVEAKVREKNNAV